MSTERATPREIEVRIEELVLHGFEPRDRHSIAEAIERSLACFLAEKDLAVAFLRNAELSVLEGRTFKVASDRDPEGIGAGIARAVHGGLIR